MMCSVLSPASVVVVLAAVLLASWLWFCVCVRDGFAVLVWFALTFDDGRTAAFFFPVGFWI